MSVPSELQKLQFDYAWKWFSYHADQRMKMLNYMLVVFGVFAAAIASTLDKSIPPHTSSFLCFIAAGLALIFSRLDRRNRDLVWLGEDVLRHLEKVVIFGENEAIKNRNDTDIRFGILWRQLSEDKTLGGSIVNDAWRGKHRVWLPLVSYLIAIVFAVSGWFVW